MANLLKTRKYHFTYKTTNKVNGRYYLGMHSTNNLEDGYLGSGKRLRYEIGKYGRENFSFEILNFYNSLEELVQGEINLVTEEILRDPNCLNLRTGGKGGFTREQAKKGRKATDRVLLEKYGEDFRRIVSRNYFDNLTEEQRKLRSQRILEGQIRSGFDRKTFLGRHHTQETKDKISKANAISQKGCRNSQYGKKRSEETKQRIREGLARNRRVDLEKRRQEQEDREIRKANNSYNGRYIPCRTREMILKVFKIQMEGRCQKGMEELKSLLQGLYEEKRMSTIQIARMYDTSYEVVRIYLKIFGVERRRNKINKL